MERLSLDELKVISGGLLEDCEAYLQQMCEKYGVEDTHDVFDLMTDEEYSLMVKWLLHAPGDPDPE